MSNDSIFSYLYNKWYKRRIEGIDRRYRRYRHMAV